jgi:hypothetical protein
MLNNKTRIKGRSEITFKIINEPPRSKLRGIPKIIQSTSSFPDLIGESRNKETGFSGQARE